MCTWFCRAHLLIFSWRRVCFYFIFWLPADNFIVAFRIFGAGLRVVTSLDMYVNIVVLLITTGRRRAICSTFFHQFTNWFALEPKLLRTGNGDCLCSAKAPKLVPGGLTYISVSVYLEPLNQKAVVATLMLVSKRPDLSRTGLPKKLTKRIRES